MRLLKWAKHCALQPRAVTVHPLHRPTLSSLFLRPAASTAKFEVSIGSFFGFLVGAFSFAQVDLRAQPPRSISECVRATKCNKSKTQIHRNLFTFTSTMPPCRSLHPSTAHCNSPSQRMHGHASQSVPGCDAQSKCLCVMQHLRCRHCECV